MGNFFRHFAISTFFIWCEVKVAALTPWKIIISKWWLSYERLHEWHIITLASFPCCIQKTYIPFVRLLWSRTVKAFVRLLSLCFLCTCVFVCIKRSWLISAILMSVFYYLFICLLGPHCNRFKSLCWRNCLVIYVSYLINLINFSSPYNVFQYKI